MLVEAILSFRSETFFLPARRIFTKFMRISGGFVFSDSRKDGGDGHGHFSASRYACILGSPFF